MDDISSCPNHFVSIKDRDWFINIHGSEESNKLELTLAPPGPQKWSTSTTLKHSSKHRNDDSLLSLGHHLPSWSGASAKFIDTVGKESTLQHCSKTSTKMAEIQLIRNTNNDDAATATATATVTAAEKIGFLPSVSTVPQKRTAPGPVVGWPPLRSFRKNLATSNITKPSPEAPQSLNNKNEKKSTESSNIRTKGMFVKINMDGIPIGRKVDLNAYDSYQNLSSGVDKLFRGLLAAQTDSFSNGIPTNLEMGKPITGLLDGSGEYTLVYEDNEGDRVLVGDVPWKMFVSTVKRLRVLKTSELPSLRLGGKQQKMEQS